jgi:fibronectin-binding autotransporter adhesin
MHYPRLTAVLFVAVSSAAFGQSTWIGSTASWTTASNWSPSGIPGADATIETGNTSTSNANLAGTRTMAAFNHLRTSGAIAFGPGGSASAFDVTGNFTLGDNTSALTLNSSASNTLGVSIGGNLTLGTNSALALGIATQDSTSGNSAINGFTVTGTTTLNTGSSLSLSRSSAAVNLGNLVMAGGTLNLTAGSGSTGTATAVTNVVTVSGLSGTGVIVAAKADTSAQLFVNTATSSTFSGTFNSGGSTALIKQGAGALTLGSTGSVLAGGVTVSGGSLIVGNANALQNAGNGNITVNGGRFDSSVANTNLGANTNFAMSSGELGIRGSSAGALNLAADRTFTTTGGTMFFNIGTFSDQVTSAGGSASFSISATTLALTLGAGFDYANTYTLFSGFNGTNSVSGLTITGYDTSGYIASLGTNGVLSFGVIPEPSSFASLAGLAALGLVGLRRRCRVKA